MTHVRALALGLLLVALLGATAEAAPRRGSWYWWWVRQAAANRAALAEASATEESETEPEEAAHVYTAAASPSPAPIEPVAAPVTTASLFALAPTSTFSTAPAPVAWTSTAAYSPEVTSPSYSHDALINFSDGPYPQAGVLTSGEARPWYESPVVHDLYGATPDAQQQAEFTSTVLARVEQTFRDSGVHVDLTTTPTDSAAHTLSVVSGAAYGPNPDAIGIADMGKDGFSFLDKLAYADSVDQLQWALARNVSHELMHTFNVEHKDKTGEFLDAATASWDMLIDPATVFSTEAAQDLLKQDFRSRFGTAGALGAQHMHTEGC
jgi:hypothetical protein